MSTQIVVYHRDGSVERCDAKCHSATTPRCTCCCGGRYHGSKLTGTFEAIREEHGEAILQEIQARAAVIGACADGRRRQLDLLSAAGAPAVADQA